MKYLIINEGLVSEYEKVKSETSPKAFAKFYHDYYSGECNKLVNAICEYKRSRGAHQKDELYFALSQEASLSGEVKYIDIEYPTRIVGGS